MLVKYQIRSEIKCKIKSGLPESELIQITVNDKNSKKLKWKERGREFILHGNMYDVVRFEKNKERTIYWCINDKKEEALFADLNKTVHNTMNTDGKYRSVLKYFVFQFYHCKSEFKDIQSFVLINRFFCNEKIAETIIKVLLPPPKSA